MTDLRVHRIRKVDGRGVEGQRHHTTLRCEHEQLVLLEIRLQPLQELTRIGYLALPVDDAIEPLHLLWRGGILVRPVRSHAPLRALMHFSGSNLHFDGLSVGTNHRGVQRLVEVELRHGDVVLETTDHRFPVTVNDTERPVTIAHVVDDDANRHQVEDVVELPTFLHHLFVDAPEVLAT